MKNDIFGAYGIPSSIHGTGGSARESYRQFLASTIQPLAKLVAEELAVKLDTPRSPWTSPSYGRRTLRQERERTSSSLMLAWMQLRRRLWRG